MGAGSVLGGPTWLRPFLSIPLGHTSSARPSPQLCPPPPFKDCYEPQREPRDAVSYASVDLHITPVAC